MEAKRQGAGDVVIGIDVGGSTTKIVGFRRTAAGAPALIEPLFVRATDPITSIYGAFGRFTVENGLTLPAGLPDGAGVFRRRAGRAVPVRVV